VAAVERDWVEPMLVHEPVLYIEGGRHPLCELCVDTFVSFGILCNAQPSYRCARIPWAYLHLDHCVILQVPNDTVMDHASRRPGNESNPTRSVIYALLD
jgi:hypothetical protein